MRPRRRRGATAVEYALVISLMLLLCFAVMDWSWVVFEWMNVRAACERGPRVAAGAPTAEDPAALATATTRAWLVQLGVEGAQVSSTLVGEELTTEVRLPVQPLIGLVPTPEVLVTRSSAVWFGAVWDPR